MAKLSELTTTGGKRLSSFGVKEEAGPSVINNIAGFFKGQFPEIVEEATGQTQGLVPEELTRMGAGIKERAPRIFKPGLEAAAKAIRGGVLPAVVPGGQTTIEKPMIAGRTAALASPSGMLGKGISTRIPEMAGLATRLGVQQIVSPEESSVPGMVAEGVGAMGAGAIKGLFNIAKQGNKAQVLTKVQDALSEAGATQKKLITDITDLMEGPVGAKAVDVGKTSRALSSVPPNVQNKILKEANVFGIEVLPDGSIKPDVKNVWRVRQALDDFLTSKDYIEATKKAKQIILSSRRAVAKVLEEADDSIKPAMKGFSDFMDSFEPVKRLLTDNKGNAIANKIIQVSKRAGEPAQKTALETFGKNFIKTQEAIKGAKQFLAGSALKTGAKRAGITAALGAIGGGVAAGVGRKVFGGGE